MAHMMDSLKIELGPRSLEQAADDLEQIARAVRSGALWSLSPHLLSGGSVQMDFPEPEEVKADPKPVVHEPTEVDEKTGKVTKTTKAKK